MSPKKTFWRTARWIREGRRSPVGEGRELARSASLAVVLLICFATMAPSCANWELTAYRTLASSNVAYEKAFAKVVELHARGQVGDANYAKAKDVATRVHALLASGTDLMASYAEIRSDATKSRVRAILAELPRLLTEIAAFVDAVRPGEALECGSSAPAFDEIPQRVAMPGCDVGRGDYRAGKPRPLTRDLDRAVELLDDLDAIRAEVQR